MTPTHEVKIVSNGNGHETSIELDGKTLNDVTAVSFYIAANDVTKVCLEFEATRIVFVGTSLNEV